MQLILRDDHLPLAAPDFICGDSAAKVSLGEGLVTGVFVHLSPAFVQKLSDQAALTDSMLIPQTHLQMQNVLAECIEVCRILINTV